jgi:hypothetical protein
MHNPIFNPAGVDYNMHNRLVCAVMDEMDVHDMKVEGNGEQNIRFFKRKVEAVLWGLLADQRLEGYQRFALKQYKNAKGDCILRGHSNRSVSFQSAQARVGPGKDPISFVLYHL